jgi:hypothetical protein
MKLIYGVLFLVCFLVFLFTEPKHPVLNRLFLGKSSTATWVVICGSFALGRFLPAVEPLWAVPGSAIFLALLILQLNFRFSHRT